MKEQYSETALGRGIQFIGIGKHGSKDLPEGLVTDILHELQSGKADPLQVGVFFGALAAKGVSPHEYRLEDFLGKGALHDPEKLYQKIATGTPGFLAGMGVKLLRKEMLSAAEAERLGDFLLSNLPGEAYRGMAASMLRIRYETEEEYQGLIRATERTYTEGFCTPVSLPRPLIQLAEPFDGVEHSYLITPLIAHYFREQGYPVVSVVGRSGGPKLALNLLDLYNELPGSFLTANSQLLHPMPPYGWALRQQDFSPALDAWTERRHRMLKRPFLATMEKVLNPCGASILITSVFHITYLEKMITLADMTGFAAVIVLKRGLEGTLAPSTARASGILCAARQPDGTWETHSIAADTEAFSAFRSVADEVVAPLHAGDNLSLIRRFTEKGQTGNTDFDNRVNLSKALYAKGMEWLNR